MAAPEVSGPVSLAGKHVLLAVSGGIAAYKAASLARALVKSGATVQVVMTASGARFVGPATFSALTARPAYTDVFDDPERILHVRLAREADVAVFAPATANLLAKLANGIADDIVTSAFLCLQCPVVLAPAMHTEMWQHPATQANVATLVGRGAVVAGPGEGDLAGGDVGPGRLVDEDVLLDAIAGALAAPATGLAGRRVVVTAGGTREPIDPVRFIGNRSSGKMGYAIATEAARRGADVTLVSASRTLPEPAGVKIVHVETAMQMRDAVFDAAATADAVIKAAAVADFRPATYSERKVKKETAGLEIELARNPDILAELGADRAARAEGRPLLVGFAAETDDEEQHGRAKLERKGIDLIVVNRVDASDAGFNVDTNRALVLGRDGRRVEVPLTTKAALAVVICDQIEGLLAGS